MEAVYLLCSIASTFFTSLILTLLIPFHLLIRRFTSPRVIYINGEQPVSLYEGTVYHERRRPVHHSFRYDVRYAFIDLDNATNVPPDHFSADEARRITETTGPVFLLTIPPSVGYEQNPLSLYYCYDLEDSIKSLRKCIAEVTNTPWGERVTFVFNPNSDVVAKPLHVSPFMDMHGNWRIKANEPTDNLYVTISVQHSTLGDYFSATLRAKRVSLQTVDPTLFFWLMPHKVALWIYWHALKLWWKTVPVVQHPKYMNAAYKEDAMIRDQKLQCCPAFGSESDSVSLDDTDQKARWFAWRDAKWPWS